MTTIINAGFRKCKQFYSKKYLYNRGTSSISQLYKVLLLADNYSYLRSHISYKSMIDYLGNSRLSDFSLIQYVTQGVSLLLRLTTKQMLK